MPEVTDPRLLQKLKGQTPAPAPSPRGGGWITDPYKEAGERRADEDQSIQRGQFGISQAAAGRDAIKDAITINQGQYETGIKPTQDRLTMVGQLASRYMADPRVKKYMLAADSYARALNTQDNPQGDLSLVYAYAKLMDPDSAVREAEGQAVSNSDTIYGRTVARMKKELGEGGSFSPEARKSLRSEMRNALGALNSGYVQARELYGHMAERYSLPPEDVVGQHAGLPYSKADAKFAGITEAKRDFYGNVIQAGQPLSPGPKGPDQIDPTGGNPLLSPEDRDYLSKNARYMDAQGIRQWFADKKLNVPETEIQRAIDYYKGGNQENATVNAPQGEGSAWSRFASSDVGQAIGGWTSGAVNGATIGGADELAALATSVSSGVPFSQALEEANRRKLAVADANPWTYNIAQLAGGLATAGGGGGLGVGSRFPLLFDIGLGAAGGALENNENRMGGAMLGGAAGGVLGSALRGITRLPGRPASVEMALANNADRAGIDAVRSRLDEAARLSVPMALADADPVLTALAGSATRLSPEAEGIAINSLLPRSQGQVDRFRSAVARDLGPVENIPQRSEDAIEQAKAAAGPLYDSAYAAPGATTLDIADLLARPSMGSALGRAGRLAAEEGRDPNTLGFVFDDLGNATGIEAPSWQTLDYVKRGLDDVVQSNRNAGAGRLDTEGRAVNDTLQQLLSRMDQMNPDYAAARAAYAGPMQERAALQAGMDAVSTSPNELAVNLGKVSPSQADQMRLGFQGRLVENADRLQQSTNPFRILNTPAMEQRLSAMYPDKADDVARLLAQRDMEFGLAGSTNEVLGNSKTAKRILADESFMNGAGDGVVDALSDVVTGQAPVGASLRALMASTIKDRARMGTIGSAKKQAEEMAPLLFNTDPQASKDTLDVILALTQGYRDRQKWLEPVAGQMGGAVGGMVPGWLAGQ